MNRPLETTFWMRFKQFMKGVFLYNTIYWRRASDDLDIKHMSREERSNLRPKRDLDIIRPREHPRPVDNEPVLSLPSEYGETSDPSPGAQMSTPLSTPPVSDAPVPDEEGTVEIRRRKKRRRSRHSKVMPKRYYEAGDDDGGGGLLGWLFRK